MVEPFPVAVDFDNKMKFQNFLLKTICFFKFQVQLNLILNKKEMKR